MFSFMLYLLSLSKGKSQRPLSFLCTTTFSFLPTFPKDGLVNVGWVDCDAQDSLCKSLDTTASTTAYFPPGATLNDREKSSVLVCIALRKFLCI